MFSEWKWPRVLILPYGRWTRFVERASSDGIAVTVILNVDGCGLPWRYVHRVSDEVLKHFHVVFVFSFCDWNNQFKCTFLGKTYRADWGINSSVTRPLTFWVILWYFVWRESPQTGVIKYGKIKMYEPTAWGGSSSIQQWITRRVVPCTHKDYQITPLKSVPVLYPLPSAWRGRTPCQVLMVGVCKRLVMLYPICSGRRRNVFNQFIVWLPVTLDLNLLLDQPLGLGSRSRWDFFKTKIVGNWYN